MNHSRRELLQGALGIGGALALTDLLPLAKAEDVTPLHPDRYFVFAIFAGGWDPQLALDPRDPSIYDDSEDTIADVGIQTGYSRLGMGADPRVFTSVEDLIFGPYIGNLADFAPRISLVRGMAMSSVSHQTAMRHALTARVPAGNSVRGSSVGTILASVLGENEAIPNLVAGSATFNVQHPLWCSGLRVSNIGDLRASLTAGASGLVDAERDALERFFLKEQQRAEKRRMQAILESRLTSRSLIEENIADLFDTSSSDLSELKELFGLNSGSTGNAASSALMAYQALTNGISRCVTFRAAGGLDSHAGDSWRSVHGPNLQKGFNSVAALAQQLEDTPYPTGGSWLDHTTIVCMSEFCRGPKLNRSGGRDHYITNSCLLMGGGITGGKIIGATSENKMRAQAVDLATGMVDNENGERISHEHIARTLLYSVGITDDIADVRVPPIDALLS
ncbi:MAG: DUF1501 domain-containing protein [Myxococcota bacterium]|nr:DUF1501 domain-containing protein [Myxococcota bacterium]